MKKNILLLILSFLITIKVSSAIEQDQIIIKVNEKNILKQNFNRILNTQKKKLHSDLNFDLLSLSIKDPQAFIKREELLRKAKQEGVIARAKDFDNTWKELITKYGGVENLETKAGQKNITIAEIRKKIEENILLDKLFEKQTKEKLIEKVIDEELLLQEAKARNIIVTEEEIIKKLGQIKQKQGGEEAFNRFLSENNATIEDAIKELKAQTLRQLVKNQINDLNSFLTFKKSHSDIVVYRNRIFPQEQNNLPEIAVNPGNADLPVVEKPAPTPPINEITVTDIKKLENETDNILAEEIQKEEYIVIDKELLIEPKPVQKVEDEKKIFVSEIKEEIILEPISVTMRPPTKTKKSFKNWISKIQNRNPKIEDEILVPGTPLATDKESSDQSITEVVSPPPQIQISPDIEAKNRLENSSQAIKELRRKIEQRRVVGSLKN